MKDDTKTDIAALRKRNLFLEDWFVCSKPLRFQRGKKYPLLGSGSDIRIFDPPNIKTVIWGGAQ